VREAPPPALNAPAANELPLVAEELPAQELIAEELIAEEAAGEEWIAEELTFADAPLEPLPDFVEESLLGIDRAAETPEDRPATAEITGNATAPEKSALPVWEVDRFHWPKTCEKLFADEHGYLSRAGDKLLAAMQDGLRVLAITGSRRGEGRSTLALSLARVAAKAGIQVAVMDGDFARPQLASKVGLEVAFGWQEAALGRVPLSEAAIKSLADNITLLPLESASTSRMLSLADPRVTATIRAAAATFELLILDLGPLGVGEEIAFPPGETCPLDAAIVVRDLRFATAAESEAAGNALLDAGIEAVGIAENFVVVEELPATSV
jgi:Mrp family chromosome partitioning ATPase